MNDTSSNVKIIVRIRGHERSKTVSKETIAEDRKEVKSNTRRQKSTSPLSRSVVVSRSKSPSKLSNITSTSSQSLNQNTNYTIFTSNSPSNTVVISPKGISGKLINENFQNTNDLYKYTYSILKNATLLEFDRVYNESHKIETIYTEQIKESISNLFNGRNSCCVLFGPTDGGKSYTLRGAYDVNETGLIGRVVNDVLNLVELSKQSMSKAGVYYVAKMSVYQVYLDSVNDLLTSNYSRNLKIEKYYDSNNCLKTQVVDLVEKEIKAKKDYDSILREAMHNRKSLTQFLHVNELKRKSNLVISVFIEKRERSSSGFKKSEERTIARYSQMDFVELASSNFGILTDRDFDEFLHKSTSKTFNSICNNIVSASIGIMPRCDSKLTLALKNTLNADSKIVFIDCVSANEEPPVKSLKSLKFTNWLRNQIYNLQCNRDYKIKSSYEDSEGEIRNGVNNRGYDSEEENFDRRQMVSQSVNYNNIENKYFNDEDNDEGSFNKERKYAKNMNAHHSHSHLPKKDKNFEEDDDFSENYSSYHNNNRSKNNGKSEKYEHDENPNYSLNKRANIDNPNRVYQSASEEEYLESMKQNKSTASKAKNIKSGKINSEDEIKSLRTLKSTPDDYKLREVEKSLRDLEQKSFEMSRYLETMKQGGIQGNSSVVLDCDYDKMRQENSTLKSDNIIFREDINRLSDINRHLEEELIRQRNRNLEIAAENERIQHEKNMYKTEMDKMGENMSKFKVQEHSYMEQINQRFLSENRIKELETENRNLRDEKQKFEVDLRVLQERHSETKRLFENSENELNYVKNRQSEEVNAIETKLDKMAKEIEYLQRENSQLRTNEERLRSESNNLEKQRDNYRDKYQDYKVKNNLLNSKLGEIEDDFRRLILEKQNENYEKNKESETKKTKVESKQKILSEMQSRIANYKSELIKQRRQKEEF